MPTACRFFLLHPKSISPKISSPNIIGRIRPERLLPQRPHDQRARNIGFSAWIFVLCTWSCKACDQIKVQRSKYKEQFPQIKMLKKVLLLSASAGAGHVRAAEAIEKAFNQAKDAANREVLHVDVLNYTNKLFRHLYSKAYIDLVNKMPEVPGWFYDKLDKPWKNERRRLALDKLNTRPFVKLLREYKPDLIVCTQFLPAEIVSWLKAKERLASRQVIIVTDFDVHAMWLVHHYERYFVALEEARVYLVALGIPPEKITVSGIPIDPVFAVKKDKQEMRAKHGLAADRTTILLSAGGFGVGSVDALVNSLLPLQHRAQIVAICGRNEELKKRLTKLAARAKPDATVTLKPFGYTKEMDK